MRPVVGGQVGSLHEAYESVQASLARRVEWVRTVKANLAAVDFATAITDEAMVTLEDLSSRYKATLARNSSIGPAACPTKTCLHGLHIKFEATFAMASNAILSTAVGTAYTSRSILNTIHSVYVTACGSVDKARQQQLPKDAMMVLMHAADGICGHLYKVHAEIAPLPAWPPLFVTLEDAANLAQAAASATKSLRTCMAHLETITAQSK